MYWKKSNLLVSGPFTGPEVTACSDLWGRQSVLQYMWFTRSKVRKMNMGLQRYIKLYHLTDVEQGGKVDGSCFRRDKKGSKTLLLQRPQIYGYLVGVGQRVHTLLLEFTR